MSVAWADCLASLAQHLAAQRLALVEGRPEDVRAYEPPAALGPVPPELAPRLRALSRESEEVSAAVAAAAASCARQLQVLHALHHPQPATASFVDARG